MVSPTVPHGTCNKHNTYHKVDYITNTKLILKLIMARSSFIRFPCDLYFRNVNEGKFISEDIFTPINSQTIWTTAVLYRASICGMDFRGLLVLVKLSDNYANLLAKYYFNWKLPDYWYSLHNFMTLPSLTKFTDFSYNAARDQSATRVP